MGTGMGTGTVFFRGARVLTMGGQPGDQRGDQPGARRGTAAGELGAIDGCDVLVEAGQVSAVGTGLSQPAEATVIEAAGRVLMPAFIDAHTHACWAGSRLDEWEAKLKGASYLDLLGRGGGIMATVRAVREASVEQLADDLADRLGLMARCGPRRLKSRAATA